MDFNPSVGKGQRSKILYSSAPHQSVNLLIAGPQWRDNKAPFVVRFYGSVCVRLRVCRPIIQGGSIRGPLDQWAAWPLHCAAGLARDVMPSIRWLHLKGRKKKARQSPTPSSHWDTEKTTWKASSANVSTWNCIYSSQSALRQFEQFSEFFSATVQTKMGDYWLPRWQLQVIARSPFESVFVNVNKSLQIVLSLLGVLFAIDLWLLKLNMVKQRLCAKWKEKPLLLFSIERSSL